MRNPVFSYDEFREYCRGSLVGGAVGDALGYTVEFMSLSEIRKRFGGKGITRYVTDNRGIARFSDDTQMTLFTLEGLMNSVVGHNYEVIEPETTLPYIEKAYLNWLKTQTASPAKQSDSWLSHIRTLWSRRAPGMTCMSALASVAKGYEVCNNSKGCGGVMRVAPIGIFNGVHYNCANGFNKMARLGGMAAEITHKHRASTFASELFVSILRLCILLSVDRPVGRHDFSDIVSIALDEVRPRKGNAKYSFKPFQDLITEALELAESNTDDISAIRKLGEGWVADEALGIALFSVTRYIDDFEKCIVCAVNHDGDSDSTGAIAGNIIGAILGYSAIPQYYLDTLEIREVLVSAADDICTDIGMPADAQRLRDRYLNHLPAGVAPELLI